MDTTPKILIVEDNEIHLKLLLNNLKKERYNVVTANNGQEAIESASSTLFDLILSDLSMPLMDGNELVRQLRKKPEYRYTPFLFLSGDKQEDTWIKNLDDGADDFLTKPYNKNILLSKIRAHLKKSSLKKEILIGSRKNTLGTNKGKLIYCKAENFSLDCENINCEIIKAHNTEDLFNQHREHNIWGIIIDEDSNWAIKDVKKIKEMFYTSPLYILISCNSKTELINSLIDLNINGLIHKNPCDNIVNFQINNIIQSEVNLKDKYLSALKAAANNSPTRFENKYFNNFNKFSLDIKHQAYGELPGGDFYEIFDIGIDEKIIIMGDVMGKKWDAWFFVPAYLAYIRSIINFLNNNRNNNFVHYPNKFLEIINNYIYKDLKLGDVFTTLSIITISTLSSKIRIASAGALRPFYLDNKTKELTQINIVGTLLGVVDNMKYQQYEQYFNTGDKLIFYTDGYTEAINSKTNEMIDENAIKSVIANNIENDNMDTEILDNELKKEYNIDKFDDDRTILIIGKQ